MCQKITQTGDCILSPTENANHIQTWSIAYGNRDVKGCGGGGGGGRVNDINLKKSKKAWPDLIGDFFWETRNFMMYSCNYVSSATI